MFSGPGSFSVWLCLDLFDQFSGGIMLVSYEKSLRVGFTVLFCVALGLQVYAQSGSGSLNGTVVDPSGAVVPNAKVEIHQLVMVLTGPPLQTVRGISVSRTYRSIRIT